MESQPQNPEFRTYPENFQPCAFDIRLVGIAVKNNLGRTMHGACHLKIYLHSLSPVRLNPLCSAMKTS